MKQMLDVLVIGKGPAGVSAAIYAQRGGVQTTLVAKDGGALLKTGDIENYYGFPEVISGPELTERGLAQVRRLGAQVLDEEVLHLEYDGNFVVKTTKQELKAKALVLATGTSRQKANIEGLERYEGTGISYCAVCDAFFYRDKDVAVLGSREYAAHEATVLLPVARSVTLLTNGEKPAAHIPQELLVNEKPIRAFTGGDTLQQVQFVDGSTLPVAGVFVALGAAGSTELARGLGVQLDGSRIVVDEKMYTNIPGLFAAGDCTGGLLQVAKAVYEGALAGMEAVKHVRKPQLEKEGF